ncbi:hypothetical protein D3C84_970270 [compost metagenome]
MQRFLPILFLLPVCALAKPAEPESVKLVNACTELVSMYDRDGQENKLLSWFGSVSEGMQAGYCRGVIVEFRRYNEEWFDTLKIDTPPCKSQGWFEQAKSIANADLRADESTTVGQLLESSCRD